MMQGVSMSNKTVFKKITNDDIYAEMQTIKASLAQYHEEMNTKIEKINGMMGAFNYTLSAVCVALGVIFTMLISHLFGIGV